MRAIVKIGIGLGAALAIYLCINALLPPQEKDARRRAAVPPTQVEALPPQPVAAVPTPQPIRQPVAPSSVTEVPVQVAERSPSDRSAELAATLEGEYATDSLPTRESLENERVIEGIFAQSGLEGKGFLEELSCRERICRGTVKLASAEPDVDNEVFRRTFLSVEFRKAIKDAVSIASRERMNDGTVLATFFIHPQAVFDMVPETPPAPDEGR